VVGVSHARPPLAVQVSDPTYGPALDARDREVAAVDVGVEGVPWEPIAPGAPPPLELVFVDGVQQVEAWITVTPHDAPRPLAAVAFAVGTGVAVADGAGVRIEDLEVRRAVVAEGDRLLRLPEVGAFRWEPRAGSGRDPQALAARVAEMRQSMEQVLVQRWAREGRLVVLDGPLSWPFLRDPRGPVVGAVKSHHTMYLEGETAGVVSALRSGERTPLFAIGEDRLSWYQRLPGVGEAGWSGILRGEVARAVGLEAARELADRATATLPRYAGRPHRDPRAPQNLMPVQGLEGRLRHRLGDRRLAFRAVRVASSRSVLDPVAAPPVARSVAA
jgi:uncharacterized protein